MKETDRHKWLACCNGGRDYVSLRPSAIQASRQPYIRCVGQPNLLFESTVLESHLLLNWVWYNKKQNDVDTVVKHQQVKNTLAKGVFHVVR